METTQAAGGRDAAPGIPSEAGDGSHGNVRSTRPARMGSWLIAFVGLLVVPITMMATLTFTGTVHDPHAIDAAGARVVTPAQLEAAYGIRVTLVAVTAEGGLVDVRFIVTDEAKAAGVLAEHGAMPALFVERTGAILSTSHPMAHKVTLVHGGTYFLLYPNSAGAVQGGTPVSIVIDDVRTTAVVAQS